MQVALIDFLGATCNQMAMIDDNKFPSQLAERFQIRLPDGMRDQIREAAEANGRSMNAEIITRLEASLVGAGGSVGGDAVDQVFTNTMQKMMEGPILPTGQQMRQLVAEYQDYKFEQIQRLRTFLDVVRDVLASTQGKPPLTLAEENQRAFENELARLRAWANAWGYDVVERAQPEKASDT